MRQFVSIILMAGLLIACGNKEKEEAEKRRERAAEFERKLREMK